MKNISVLFDSKYQKGLKRNVKIFDGHDVTTKEIWSSLVESIPDFVKMVEL